MQRGGGEDTGGNWAPVDQSQYDVILSAFCPLMYIHPIY